MEEESEDKSEGCKVQEEGVRVEEASEAKPAEENPRHFQILKFNK